MRTAKIGLYILLFLGIGLSAQGYQLPELIPFRLGDTWGYCDQDGALRIPANYDAAMPFRAGTAVIFRKDRAGLIDQDGNVLLPFVYDEIFNDAYLRIRKNTHFALANKEGKLLTQFVFDQIFPEKSGLFRIENNGLMGMIDTAGKAIIPPLYQHISILRDAKGNYTDLIQVHLDGKYGIYDRCGTALSKPIYASIGVFWDGFAIVKREGRFGMIDLEGQEVVLAVYENLHPLREGLSAALVRGRWGFVDTEGQEAIPFRYTEVNGEGFYQGRAAVFFRDEWTFIDRQGRAKISVKGPYSCLGSLSEGLASACILSKSGHPFYGYLNQNGRLVIPCEFARAYPFRDGFALTGQYVTSQESHSPKLRFGVIDRKGREIIPHVMSSLAEARHKRDSIATFGWTSYVHQGQRCKVDQRGRTFGCAFPAFHKIMMEFEQTRCENAALIAVAQAGLWGYCDQSGKEVIPLKYSRVNCFSDGLAMVWPDRESTFCYYIDYKGKEYYQMNQDK